MTMLKYFGMGGNKKYIVIVVLVVSAVAGCESVQKENSDTEKMRAAYTFLFEKLQEDNINLIASERDENLNLIEDIIKRGKFNLKVERYGNIERDSSLCYYSRSTKEGVALVGVTKRGEKNFYISYYLGPEGGASKEIRIEKRHGRWIIVNDDGRWSVK